MPQHSLSLITWKYPYRTPLGEFWAKFLQSSFEVQEFLSCFQHYLIPKEKFVCHRCFFFISNYITFAASVLTINIILLIICTADLNFLLSSCICVFNSHQNLQVIPVTITSGSSSVCSCILLKAN